MSKGLEELKEFESILKRFPEINLDDLVKYSKLKTIIEKELKEADFLSEHYRELLAYSNKRDKVLEIIKKYGGINESTWLYISRYNYKEYMEYRSDYNPSYTKEEYDLLKEVLSL